MRLIAIHNHHSSLDVRQNVLLAVLAAWNAVVFILYGIDKRKSKHARRRIPERALLSLAFLMGAPSALAGMIWFNHKTRHAKFYVGVPLLVILNLSVCGQHW